MVSACGAWAVGFYNNGDAQQPLVEHWNGSAWKAVPAPDTGGSSGALVSVRPASATSVWAVGAYATMMRSNTLIVHWNGTRWAQVASPNPGRGNELFAVAATA